ncbi:hypothetical protein BAUCODRAFT_214770 [Baudoinia panamericana UAMH 10762]|uniref:Uncharacterized protein n=1 Tax=Baudoinia panamericana (strain UAMH 10762) TaxID=717646 RepID=M2MR48_BAUPA|nr:uncharacterized protein BAUCODRAFT_214770 [Baudoinia panamericana UAMH 10762]EMC93938.1 hypothetical protein BAUCODRAFT_214770 [Baudoinia panamericana UAMH 10762]
MQSLGMDSRCWPGKSTVPRLRCHADKGLSRDNLCKQQCSAQRACCCSACAPFGDGDVHTGTAILMARQN